MKALSAVTAKIFPGLSYWTRLPGLVAFCGMAAGVCAARYCLAAAYAPAASVSIFIRSLFCAAIVCAAAGIVCRRRSARAALFFVCGAALYAAGDMNLRDVYGKMEAACERNRIQTLTIRISSPVSEAYSSYRFRAKVTGSDNAEIARILRGKTLQFTTRKTVPPYGAMTVQGRFLAPRPAAGTFGFDQREHMAVNNIYGNFTVSRVLPADSGVPGAEALTVRGSPPESVSLIRSLSPDNISYVLRKRVHGVINRASTEDARGIFHAAFLGEKEHLPADLKVLFRRSGIVHLLAISGFHAALLYSAVFAALGLFAIPPKTRTILALSALWAYLFFIGFIPSLFRATVMVTFFCLSMMLQRKNHPIHSLGLAGVLWLMLSPRSLFAPGFQLSFAATAGIVMLQPVLNMLTKGAEARINGAAPKFIAGKTLAPFWVSVASFAATAPPLLHHFGTLSLYGILFNIIAIPLMSVAMWLFFVSIVLSPVAVLSGAAVWCSEKVLSALIYLAGFSGHLALSEIAVPHTAGIQLFAMVIFMVGLCGVRKEWRGIYSLRIGGAASLIIAAVTLHMTVNAKTETFSFTRGAAAAEVVIHKDNTAWIAAQGRAFDVKQLREREIEPLISRKKVRAVPLFVISEDAEEEAHAFMFAADYDPRIVTIRKEVPGSGETRGGRPRDDGYTRIEKRVFVSADGACSLRVSEEGGLRIKVFKSLKSF